MPATGPNNSIRGTGNAPVVRVGHTAGNQNASNPNAKVMGRAAAKDLKLR